MLFRPVSTCVVTKVSRPAASALVTGSPTLIELYSIARRSVVGGTVTLRRVLAGAVQIRRSVPSRITQASMAGGGSN